MIASPHGMLFKLSGPDIELDYLWSRLGSLDLSQDEALAMVSAVHRQIGSMRAEDPSVYASYSRFMETLNHQMPVVHDFVVTRWSENRHVNRGVKPPIDNASGEMDAEPEASAGKPAPAQHGTAEEADREAAPDRPKAENADLETAERSEERERPAEEEPRLGATEEGKEAEGAGAE